MLEAAVVVLAVVLAVLAVLTVRLYRQFALMYLLRDPERATAKTTMSTTTATREDLTRRDEVASDGAAHAEPAATCRCRITRL